MGKFSYFNDTGREVSIHPATSIHGTTVDMSVIPPLSIRVFELPDGSYPWVKMWDYGEERGLSILVSPTMDNESKNGEPEHIGKYPVTFSFTKKESGQKLLEYFYKLLLIEEVHNNDMHINTTLKMLIEQIRGHLYSGGE